MYDSWFVCLLCLFVIRFGIGHRICIFVVCLFVARCGIGHDVRLSTLYPTPIPAAAAAATEFSKAIGHLSLSGQYGLALN